MEKAVNPINKEEAYITVLDGDMREDYSVSDFVKLGIKGGDIEINLPNEYTLHETLKNETLFEHLDRMEKTPPEPVELNEAGRLPPPAHAPFIRRTKAEGKGFTIQGDIDQSIYDFFTHDPGGSYQIMNPDGSVREQVQRAENERGMDGISDEYRPEIEHEFYQEQLQYLRSTRHIPTQERPRVEVLGDNPSFDKVYDAADFEKWLKALDQAGYEGNVEYDVLEGTDDNVIYHGRQHFNEDFIKKVKSAKPEYRQKPQPKSTYQENVERSQKNAEKYAEENPGPEAELYGYPAPGGKDTDVPPTLRDVVKTTFQAAKSFVKAEHRRRMQSFNNAMQEAAYKWEHSFMPPETPPIDYQASIATKGSTIQADVGTGITSDKEGRISTLDKSLATYSELPAGGKLGFRRMLERAAQQEYQLVNLKDYDVSVEHYKRGQTSVSLIDRNNRLFCYQTDGDLLKKHDQYVIFKDGKALVSAKDSEAAYKKLGALKKGRQPAELGRAKEKEDKAKKKEADREPARTSSRFQR